MFQTVSPSIIRSPRLYIQFQVDLLWKYIMMHHPMNVKNIIYEFGNNKKER